MSHHVIPITPLKARLFRGRGTDRRHGTSPVSSPRLLRTGIGSTHPVITPANASTARAICQSTGKTGSIYNALDQTSASSEYHARPTAGAPCIRMNFRGHEKTISRYVLGCNKTPSLASFIGGSKKRSRNKSGDNLHDQDWISKTSPLAS